MTLVTGVSGSGKSTLVNEILYKSLAKQINKSKVKPGDYDEIQGIDQLDRIIDIDQSPIEERHVQIQRPIQVYLITSEIFLPKRTKQK